MEQQPSPNFQPEQPVQPAPVVSSSRGKQKIVIWVALGILILVLASAGYYVYSFYYWSGYQRACTMEAKLCPDGSSVGRTGPNCEFAQCPADETADWQTHTSAAMGFTFKYPKDYSAPQEQENYLSLISPLNPNRAPKMLELQDGELKIEIVTEAGQENDSVLKCWNDHNSGNGRILSQGSIAIAGASYELLTWEGLGTGQFTCINHGGKRYLINKYPAQTTRQNEYDGIMASFRFIDPTADWQTYKNEQYGFEVKYPKGWTLSEGQRGILARLQNKELSEAYGTDGELSGYFRAYSSDLSLDNWFKEELSRREAEIAYSIDFMNKESTISISRSDIILSEGNFMAGNLLGKFDYRKQLKPFYIEGGPYTTKRYFFKDDGLVYEFYISGNTGPKTDKIMKIADQIASTFKFISR